MLIGSPRGKDKTVESGSQELDLDIIFKYLVRHPSGGQVGNWRYRPGDQSAGDVSLEYLKLWDQVRSVRRNRRDKGLSPGHSNVKILES